ncbi:flagellar hook assembly protein FlgD [Modicisalibacter tunisiensis]|uniref:flagellar hook assembly protein FlgD n=1 Tax=Modicisalibacter TaxID=574347 RepID=UPI0013D7CCF2|nr:MULTISPECIES: flagellar hook assembly protein FlgD [Modicisalibacter]MBZ9538325.1 flagellar hook assembly protein FlgD [Modicisalibacter tunisiensis]
MANTIDSNVLNNMNLGAAAKQATGSTEDLSSSFMTLLVTQLKNQNPMKPMENAEMTSQLAQINTVNGINQLNDTLDSLASQIDTGQSLQAAALIGQGVLVPGDQVLKKDDATTPFGIELDSPADTVNVSIVGQNGEVVRTIDPDQVGALKAGTQSFVWDGTRNDGTTAPDGAYHVRIEATQGGEAVPVTALNYARVNGVVTTDSGPRLDLGAIRGQVGLDSVRQIL